MRVGRARELCASLTVVPYDFAAYETASALVYEALLSFGAHTPFVNPIPGVNNDSINTASNPLSTRCQAEIVSVDEAYVAIPAGSDGLAAASELAARVRDTVVLPPFLVCETCLCLALSIYYCLSAFSDTTWHESNHHLPLPSTNHQLTLALLITIQVLSLTGCRLSVGVGPSKLLARLATRRAKPPNPTGIFVINEQSALAVLNSGGGGGGGGSGGMYDHDDNGGSGAYSSTPTPHDYDDEDSGGGGGGGGGGRSVIPVRPSSTATTPNPNHNDPATPLNASPVVRAFLLDLPLSDLPGVGYVFCYTFVFPCFLS
jgi:nucleotidyltransferase/DNA polymerase involved in DNA repair